MKLPKSYYLKHAAPVANDAEQLERIANVLEYIFHEGESHGWTQAINYLGVKHDDNDNDQTMPRMRSSGGGSPTFG